MVTNLAQQPRKTQDHRSATRSPISLLIPDMPCAAGILPYLQAIDRNRFYSNFGPLVQELEAKLTDYLSTFSPHANFVTTCSTGTDAIELALRALHLPKGAAVLLPAYTFVGSGLAVLRAGYTPVFADVDNSSWCLTPDIARNMIIEYEFDAVLPVASYGIPQDTAAWDAFTLQTGIPVVIDAAGAFGNQALGKTTRVIFSLHATKLFGAGEGGLVCGSDQNYIETVHRLSNFGKQAEGVHELATNSKLSEYHAAVALAQLDRWPLKYGQHLSSKQKFLKKLSVIPTISTQHHSQHFATSNLAVRFLTDDVEQIVLQLAAKGIESRRYYTPILSEEPLFREYEVARLPVTQRLLESVLCLPFHHLMSDDDMDYVVETLSTHE